jgi:hypothetical protein
MKARQVGRSQDMNKLCVKIGIQSGIKCVSNKEPTDFFDVHYIFKT